MGSRLLSNNVPLTRVSRSPTFGHLEGSTESFLRHSICRRSRSYTSSTSPSLRVAWRDSKVREFRELNNINALSTRLLNADARRFKSGRVQAKQEHASSEARHLGDEPPLYDGKPALWARWVFLLLAADMLFTVDMVMRNWTRLIETPPTSAAPSPKPDSSSSESTTTSSSSSEKYELRPLWQRLGLASFEVVVGAAAGALILASRDRTVWRLRVRRVPISTLPPGRGGMRLPPPASSYSSSSSSSSSSGAQTINVLSLETGSGRTKRFLVRDCVLMPGRDLSELFLSIGGIRGRFVLPIQNDARVLGVSAADISGGESNVLKELLLASKENGDVALINSTATTTGGADLENTHVAELRKALALAWIKVGGTLSVPRVSLQRPGDGWTSGPVVEGTR